MPQNSSRERHWLLNQVARGLNRENFALALRDIVEGWERRDLWATIGLHDIRQRYRRSFLGPFWITLSMGILVGALGLLYGRIFQRDLNEYLPYLAAGYITWGLLSASVLDGAKSFLRSEGLIKQLAAPLSIHVYRATWVALIIFAHNMVIYVALAIWFSVNVSWTLLLFFPAISLLVLNTLWMGLFLGLLSARYRDIPMVLASVMQVMFFITPVLWTPDMLADRVALMTYNPLYYFVDLVRSPLLGEAPSLNSWIVVLVLAVLGWFVAMLFYTIYRWRIAYWV